MIADKWNDTSLRNWRCRARRPQSWYSSLVVDPRPAFKQSSRGWSSWIKKLCFLGPWALENWIPRQIRCSKEGHSLQHSRTPFGQEAHAMHAKTYPSLSFLGRVKTNGRSARDLLVVSFENFSIQAKSFAVGIESERTSENMNQRPQAWHTLWYPHKPQYLCTSPHRRHETLAPKASPIWDSHGEAQYLPSAQFELGEWKSGNPKKN